MEKSIRFIIKSAIVLSLIAGGFYAAQDDWGRAALFMIVGPIILYFPSWIYEHNHKKIFSLKFLAEMEIIIILGLGLAVLGENFLYSRLPLFDSIVHFINGTLLTILVVSLNHKRWLDGRLSSIYTVFLAGFLPSILNEIYEWGLDAFLGANVWGDIFKPLWLDTFSDMALQTLGSIIAIFILKKHFHLWLERWEHKKPEVVY